MVEFRADAFIYYLFKNVIIKPMHVVVLLEARDV